MGEFLCLYAFNKELFNSYSSVWQALDRTLRSSIEMRWFFNKLELWLWTFPTISKDSCISVSAGFPNGLRLATYCTKTSGETSLTYSTWSTLPLAHAFGEIYAAYLWWMLIRQDEGDDMSTAPGCLLLLRFPMASACGNVISVSISVEVLSLFSALPVKIISPRRDKIICNSRPC